MVPVSPAAAGTSPRRRPGFHQRGPACIPVYEQGRCAEADRYRAEQQRQYERQAGRRWQAEELGDPRR